MEKLTESQFRRRRHAETVIGAVAPLLDLILAAGEKLSRAAEPVDYEYYPVRVPDDNEDPFRSSRVSPSSDSDADDAPTR